MAPGPAKARRCCSGSRKLAGICPVAFKRVKLVYSRLRIIRLTRDVHAIARVDLCLDVRAESSCRDRSQSRELRKEGHHLIQEVSKVAGCPVERGEGLRVRANTAVLGAEDQGDVMSAERPPTLDD